MREQDTMRLQDVLQNLSDLIENKDCEIERWKEREKEAFDKGYADGVSKGMQRAWEVADDIVHMKWDGALVMPKTVEEWFEVYTAEEACRALSACRMAKGRPHWVTDLKNHCYVCSSCNGDSQVLSRFCPWCGVDMWECGVSEK